MKLHGAFSFASLWLFGLLWGVHVIKGWSGGRRRWSGGTLAGILIGLMLTGYLLYYVGDEDVRDLVSIAHFPVAHALPHLLFMQNLAAPHQTTNEASTRVHTHPRRRRSTGRSEKHT